MTNMFSGCKSLRELNISKFKIYHDTDVRLMFNNCSEQLKNKIRNLNLNLKEEAFRNFY